MKKFNFIIFLYLLLPCKSVFGDETLIDIALQKRKSIVTIISQQIELTKSPQSQAVINPTNGKIVTRRKIRTVQAQKMGAGVIIDPSGLIVTNYHIVSSATHIKVKLYNNEEFYAQLVTVSPRQDLAFLQISAPYPLLSIDFIDSNTAQLGEEIIHIGNSEILHETISEGRIVGLATRTLKNNKKSVELIKVNINIYKGDSGGPVLDKQGRLLGMLASKLRNKQRASFAIPSNVIRKLFSKIRQQLQR